MYINILDTRITGKDTTEFILIDDNKEVSIITFTHDNYLILKQEFIIWKNTLDFCIKQAEESEVSGMVSRYEYPLHGNPVQFISNILDKYFKVPTGTEISIDFINTI